MAQLREQVEPRVLLFLRRLRMLVLRDATPGPGSAPDTTTLARVDRWATGGTLRGSGQVGRRLVGHAWGQTLRSAKAGCTLIAVVHVVHDRHAMIFNPWDLLWLNPCTASLYSHAPLSA